MKPVVHVKGDQHNYTLHVPNRDGVLPKGVGYTSHTFANDVYGLVKGEKVNRLRKVGEGWARQGKIGKMPRLHCRAEAVRLRRVLHTLKLCGIIPQALQAFGGDAEAATQWILEQVTTEEMIQEGGGSGPKGQGRLEKKVRQLSKANQIASNAQKKGKKANGKTAGSDHATLVQKILRVDDLLPKCRGRYVFASTKGVKLEPIPHPEDTLDVRPLRTYGELRQVPPSWWLQEEEVVMHKLATRGVPVIQHYRIKPEPETFALLLDVSGSMASSAADSYTGEEWATAHAVALLEAAAEGGNEVVLIRFDGAPHPVVRGRAERVLEDVWTCQFSGGGTDIQRALDAGSEVEGVKRLILISDGESHLTGAAPAAPLDTILINATPNETLRAISDRLLTL